MAGGWDWRLNWDVSPLKRGGQQAADAIENAVEVFEDLAKSADNHSEKAGDSLADEVKAGGNKAERALDDLEQAFRQTAEEADKRSKRMGDDLGDRVKRGAKDGEEGLDTLSENAGSNAKEIGASFDGSFEGLADGIQGFVAEATEGFGAVGLVAGVGFAAAIGIGLNALSELAEKANTLTTDAADLGTSLAEAVSVDDKVSLLRDRFSEVADEIGDARSVWEVWQSRARTQGEMFADAIKQGSLSADDLTAAFSNPDPIARLADLRDVAGQLQTAIDRAKDTSDEFGTR